MPMPGRRTCRRAWRRSGREATSLCCSHKCTSLGDLVSAEPAKCLTGVCLCTGDIAKQAVFLGCRLLANMKTTFAPSSGSRTLLLEGRTVLELIGKPMVDNRSFDELVYLQDAYDTLILHAGLQYLKPCRPTFLVVMPGEGGPEIPAGAGRRLVQVKNVRFKGRDKICNSVFQFFDSLTAASVSKLSAQGVLCSLALCQGD